MKLKHLLIIFCLISYSNLFAQTKLISHKSHSGSNSNFKLALENNLFDLGNSNFGQVPFREIKKAQLDSLIFLTDTSVIMVTTEYCGWIDVGTNNKKQKMNDPKIWQAGSDTVFHHELFSRNFSIDTIKKKLDEDYFFRNPADSVVFINHDVPLFIKGKGKKKLRKEKRKAKKDERKKRRQAKKDRKDNKEKSSEKSKKSTNAENQNSKKNPNNTFTMKNQILSSIGGIGLFALFLGWFISRRQNRFL